MERKYKRNVLGVLVDAVDYDHAVEAILDAAQAGRGFSVSALAVHGVMTGVLDREHRYRLNHLDLLAPDGQPVRWAMRLLYGTRLKDRVYGPQLMLEVCRRATIERLSIYLYGGTREILDDLWRNLLLRFPDLIIAGAEPSKFRKLTPAEKEGVASRICSSGASIVFVGIGCPRQEVWAYEFTPLVSRPVLAVGAAFAFHAGRVPQAPAWMQDAGLEWLFRLSCEPRRLWKRYLFLNPAYLFLLALQTVKLNDFVDEGKRPRTECLYG
jgi:exopolysaccharide biosynthesis WecB/TagA/CpsF family protein